MSEHHGLDDAELLGRAVGELAALEALYRRYVRRIAGFAARRCTSPDDVADVVALTFDRLLRSASRYDPERGSVASFVFAIAESQVAELHRRAARDEKLASRLAGHQLLDDDDIARAEAAIDAAATVAALGPELAALPSPEHAVLQLVAEGLSPSEAAQALAITPNVARVRLSRARRRMRAHVHPSQTEQR